MVYLLMLSAFALDCHLEKMETNYQNFTPCIRSKRYLHLLCRHLGKVSNQTKLKEKLLNMHVSVIIITYMQHICR
jgi:hypothetical protein